MPTILSSDTPDVPDRSEEATMSQIGYIERLVNSRRVSGVCAAKIIALLLNEPDPGADGGHNKDINEAVRRRIEREP